MLVVCVLELFGVFDLDLEEDRERELGDREDSCGRKCALYEADLGEPSNLSIQAGQGTFNGEDGSSSCGGVWVRSSSPSKWKNEC